MVACVPNLAAASVPLVRSEALVVAVAEEPVAPVDPVAPATPRSPETESVQAVSVPEPAETSEDIVSAVKTPTEMAVRIPSR